MKKQLLWRLTIAITAGVVVLFYFIHFLLAQTEEEMSMLEQRDRDELLAWGKEAESLYKSGNIPELESWLISLEKRENTRAMVVKYDVQDIAGNDVEEKEYTGFNFGRSVDWKIHLYFKHNPLMELPFSNEKISLLVVLPDRMRPGSYLSSTRLILQIILPTFLLSLLSWLLYRHIMRPLIKLQNATKAFSSGHLSVRVGQLLGKRNDEFSDLANTFDHMASRIGELINSQRQLIADMSHELRTPLARLDMAVSSAQRNVELKEQSLQRVHRESQNIRRLVEDALTLSWLENEQPSLSEEKLDLVDLLDVIVDDAKFEFPDREVHATIPNHAKLYNSNHQAVGQALENIIRNALRFTPSGGAVELTLAPSQKHYTVQVKDQGPGVPEMLLETIFKPFFRIDKSRSTETSSFGLGLSLSRRQLSAVGATVKASNQETGGLCMTITLPKA